jgi:hypothetical protein
MPKLENAIEDAYGFHFGWTGTCEKANNKLNNLTQRNTKKRHEYRDAKYAKGTLDDVMLIMLFTLSLGQSCISSCSNIKSWGT